MRLNFPPSDPDVVEHANELKLSVFKIDNQVMVQFEVTGCFQGDGALRDAARLLNKVSKGLAAKCEPEGGEEV